MYNTNMKFQSIFANICYSYVADVYCLRLFNLFLPQMEKTKRRGGVGRPEQEIKQNALGWGIFHGWGSYGHHLGAGKGHQNGRSERKSREEKRLA